MSDIQHVMGAFGRWGKRLFSGYHSGDLVDGDRIEVAGVRTQDQAEALGPKSWSVRHHYIREDEVNAPKTVAVLWGPQGSGKTRVAADLAKALKLNTIITCGLPTLKIRVTTAGRQGTLLSGWRDGALYVVQANSLAELKLDFDWPGRVAAYSVEQAQQLLRVEEPKIDIDKERAARARRVALDHGIDWAKAVESPWRKCVHTVEQANDACSPEHYEVTANAIQEIKDAIYANATTTLTPLMRESLDQICVNIGRIITSHPDHVGSWTGISRYAGLVSARLNNPPTSNK